MLFVSFVTIANTTFAQNCAGFEAFPSGATEGKKIHVLYRDFINKKDYESAFPMWQQLMEHAAGGHVYHFIDGVTIYKAFAERDVADPEKVAAHVQKIADLYEQRIKCFSTIRKDEGAVLEMMAYDLSVLGYSDKQKVLSIFEKAVKMNGNATSAYILAYYADYVINLFGTEQTTAQVAREVYLTLESIKETNKDKSDYLDNWNYVEQYYEPYVDYIFDCSYFKNKLMPQYEANPNNPENYRAILRTLLQKGCTENDEFVRLLNEKDSLQILVEADSLETVFKTNSPDFYAKKLLSEGKVDESTAYFQKALSLDLGAERLADANYYLAKIYHSKGGASNFAKARGYYQTAANLKANWGDPYYQIGLMYASSGPLCGTGRGWESQVVVWAAMDAWNQAIATGDAEATSKARQKMNYYEQFLPTNEDGHERSIKNGETYTIGCWIQKSTKVRLRNQY
jgi:hypothetical protein